jgi:DNA repair exonuclease SbcCD nuclease subunit
MIILRVGDPHAKVSNLEEMKKLFLFVADMAKKRRVNRIEILGDLFHSHAVLRLEVQEYWTWALSLLSDICETIVLVGNHDLSGDYGSSFSALSLFNLLNKKNLIIIEKPQCLGAFGYVPYCHNNDNFIHSALALSDGGARILVCHQTIQGSRYESGLYAPDGVQLGEWSKRFLHVISGHIHAEQEFENVIYPGTARWDTTSDANQRKGIWIYEHSEDGRIQTKEFITTDQVCSPLLELTYEEGGNEPNIPPNARVSLLLKGNSEWVRKEKEKFKGRASLKTKFTDAKITESRKTGTGLEDFLKNVFVSTMDKEHLIKLAKEMGIV